jgi:hypothetical protein
VDPLHPHLHLVPPIHLDRPLFPDVLPLLYLLHLHHPLHPTFSTFSFLSCPSFCLSFPFYLSYLSSSLSSFPSVILLPNPTLLNFIPPPNHHLYRICLLCSN